MKARYPGRCVECERAFGVGEEIVRGVHTGWGHAECVTAAREGAKAEYARQDAEDAEYQRVMGAKFRACELAEVRVDDTTVVVRNVPTYQDARSFAQSFVDGVTAATGMRAGLVVRKRAGKRYVGRELRFGGYGGTMTYHDGWAFDWRQA